MSLTFEAAFLAGLLSFLSPCVLPLVPPYLGFLAGASIDQLHGRAEVDSNIKLRLLLVAVMFVLGFGTVFVSLGATASAFGQVLARFSLELGFLAGVVIFVMGLHFLGVFRLALLYREARFSSQVLKAGPMGAYIMGLAFAFGWTPCIGPILAAILVIAGGRDTVSEGALLLAVYTAGLGVPFVLAGLFAPTVLGALRHVRKHMRKVEMAMGALLIITGVMFMTGTMSRVSFWLIDLFPALARLG